jgi:fucose 4-O-acetylase-like acetyltransferase
VPSSRSGVRAEPSIGARPSRDGRDPWLDNAKYALITLVVVGHVIGTFRRDVPGASAAYVWIYAFHMPAFVFLAGYLSRGTETGPRQSATLFSRILVPYLIFESLYSLWNWRLEGGELEVSLLEPHWIMWFLLALFIWRLAAPHLQRLRFPLATAVVISLGSGMIPDLGRFLTLHRVFALLPFFVLGLVVRPGHLAHLRRRGTRLVAVGALLLAIPGAVWAAGRFADRWFYHRSPYADLDVGVVEGVMTRGGILLAGVVLGAAVLALVPQRRTAVSPLGAGSMYPYLLHGFAIMGVEATGLADRITTIEIAAVAVGLAVIGTLVLSSAPLRWLTRPLVAPPTGWLLRSERDEHRDDPGFSERAARAPVGEQLGR